MSADFPTNAAIKIYINIILNMTADIAYVRKTPEADFQHSAKGRTISNGNLQLDARRMLVKNIKYILTYISARIHSFP